MGYRVFHVRSGVSLKHTLPLAVGADYLENHWWRLEFDPATGELTRLIDNVHKVDVLKRGHILAAMVDNSDTWSHGVQEYRVEARRFGNAALRVVEQGDVQATLRVHAAYDRSTAITEYTLYRETDHMSCDLRLNWQQQYQALKLAFETHIVRGTATFEVPYGCQERVPDGGEEPGQQWFDLTGEIGGLPYGLAVLNDSKYSFDVRDGVLRVTLLRSPAYAHHDNGRFDASALWPIMDQGWQRVKLELMPHAGDWRDARVVKRGWELNAPAFVHPESAHPGGHVCRRGSWVPGGQCAPASSNAARTERILLSGVMKPRTCREHACICLLRQVLRPRLRAPRNQDVPAGQNHVVAAGSHPA